MSRRNVMHEGGRPSLKWDLPVFINLNARSLSTDTIYELQVTVGVHDASLVCVSETWFKGIFMGNDSLNLYGFNLERTDRHNGRAGGVACYIRNDVLSTRLNNIEEDELEIMWVDYAKK